MKLSQNDFISLRTITPNRFAAFLTREGWHRLDNVYSKFIAFEGKSLALKENVEIIIPDSNEYVDYYARLIDAINLLSQHFCKIPGEIIKNIIQWDRDIHLIRIMSPANNELLSLNFATGIIAKYRDFFAYAACTESKPQRFYSKLSKSGKEFADNCCFGHTFSGSFGLTIECPLPPGTQRPLPGVSPLRLPFQRAVTERIATGYSDLRDAIATEDPSKIIDNHLKGFSGNMCEILTDVYEMLNGCDIENSISWATELEPPDQLKYASAHVTEISYEILRVASVELQKLDEPEEDKTIVGRIIELKSKAPPLEDQEAAGVSRSIVVKWAIDQTNALNIHIDLPIQLYRNACDAHKNGRNLSIQGKPEKRGKFWYLLDHHNFEII